MTWMKPANVSGDFGIRSGATGSMASANGTRATVVAQGIGHAVRSPETFAGFIQVMAPARLGTYKITLSSEAWIDVVQDGQVVKSGAFSGATGCEGIRKSVKFELAAAPFIIEISGVTARTIAIVVTPE